MVFYFKKLTVQLIKLGQIGEKVTTKPDRGEMFSLCYKVLPHLLSRIQHSEVWSDWYRHRKSAVIYLQPSALRCGNRWAHDQQFKMTSNISLIDFKFLRTFFFSINNLWNNETLFGFVLSFIQLKQTQQRNQREKLKAAQNQKQTQSAILQNHVRLWWLSRRNTSILF